MVREVSGLGGSVLKARYVLSIATQFPTHRAKPRNSIAIHLAIAFLKASNLSRAKGGDVAAHLAYRAGLKLTGTNDFYKRKQTIQEAYFVGWSGTHDKFAKAVNTAEKRKDSRLIKELIWALPHDATDEQRSEITRTYAESLRDRFGVAVHVAIHKPKPKDTAILPSSGLNWHAHISITRRAVDDGGKFAAKALPQIDKEAWLDAEKDRLVDLVNSVVLEPTSREPIYGAPVPTVGRAWQAERQAEAAGEPITTQPGERFRAFALANSNLNLQAEKEAVEKLEKEIEYERALTAAELRREAAATAAAKANAERIAAAEAAERSRALAERNRTTLERLRSLTESAYKIFGKIFRIGPIEIRRLDEKTGGYDRAHELARGAGGRLGEAVRLNALKKHDLHGELQRGGSGVPETAESLRRNEDRIPRIVLPDFDLTAIALRLERKKMRKGGLMPLSMPKIKADLDFISQHLSGEEYDPKKHGPLLPEDRPKNRGHGPSL